MSIRRHNKKIGGYAGIRCNCCAAFGCTKTHKSKKAISRRVRRKTKQKIDWDLIERDFAGEI